MKHFTKAVMITAASMLAVTGCSDKDSGAADAAGTGSDSAVTLKFMTQSSPLAPADPNQKLIFQRMEQKTGIHIEWKSYTSETFAEKRNLALATGDLPDAIFDAGLGDYDLLRLAKDGTIIPLDGLIEKDAELQEGAGTTRWSAMTAGFCSPHRITGSRKG